MVSSVNLPGSQWHLPLFCRGGGISSPRLFDNLSSSSSSLSSFSSSSHLHHYTSTFFSHHHSLFHPSPKRLNHPQAKARLGFSSTTLPESAGETSPSISYPETLRCWRALLQDNAKLDGQRACPATSIGFLCTLLHLHLDPLDSRPPAPSRYRHLVGC